MANSKWIVSPRKSYNVRPPRYLSWFITPITMVYGTQITIVTGAYKPTNIPGGLTSIGIVIPPIRLSS